jgi:hypothetical protein
MSNTVLEPAAKILAHRPMGRNKMAVTSETVRGHEGGQEYEKTYRNHCRKASGRDRQAWPVFSRRLVRSVRYEGANGNGRRRVTHRPGNAAHHLSLGRKRTTAFHGIAGWVAVDLPQIARLR